MATNDRQYHVPVHTMPFYVNFQVHEVILYLICLEYAETPGEMHVTCSIVGHIPYPVNFQVASFRSLSGAAL